MAIATSIERDEKLSKVLPKVEEKPLGLMEQLAEKYGILFPVIVDDNTDRIVDGYTRDAISSKTGKPYDVKRIPFESEDEIREFMLMFQLARRQLTQHQTKLLLAELYKRRLNSKEKLHDGNTRKKVAKEAGVSEGSIANAVGYADDYDKLSAPAKKWADDRDKTPPEVLSKLSGLPKKKQDEVIEKVSAEDGPDIKDALGIKKAKKAKPTGLPKATPMSNKETFDPAFAKFRELQKILENISEQRGGQGPCWSKCDEGLEMLHSALSEWSVRPADAK